LFPLIRHLAKILAEPQGGATDFAISATLAYYSPPPKAVISKEAYSFTFGTGGVGVFWRAGLTSLEGLGIL